MLQALLMASLGGLQRGVVCLGWPIAPSYISPKAGGRVELLGLSKWVQLYTAAQINFGDLTPYLTYGVPSLLGPIRFYRWWRDAMYEGKCSALRRWTWTGDFKCREVKTGFYRNRSMQTGSSGTLIGWISGQTSFVPLWDWMEGAWLRTLFCELMSLKMMGVRSKLGKRIALWKSKTTYFHSGIETSGEMTLINIKKYKTTVLLYVKNIPKYILIIKKFSTAVNDDLWAFKILRGFIAFTRIGGRKLGQRKN